jgi:hypothetical protein
MVVWKEFKCAEYRGIAFNITSCKGTDTMMRRGKKDKTIRNISVSELLDGFTDIVVDEDSSRDTGMTDEEYVKLMLKKEAAKKQAKPQEKQGAADTDKEDTNNRAIQETSENCTNCFYCARVMKVGDTLLCACTNSLRELEARYFEFKWWVLCQNHAGCWEGNPDRGRDRIQKHSIKPKTREGQEIETVETQLRTKDPTSSTSDTTETISKRFEPEIPTPEVEAAVKFLRDEIISSSSKREALQTIEKYRKETPVRRKKKPEKPVSSEKTSLMKKCQNCYFCVAERTIGGSYWCHCTNLSRTTEERPGKSWVKGRINLPCWKSREE